MEAVAWAVATILMVCFGLIVFRGAPYVPTLPAQLRTAFRLYPLQASDLVVDLGAGDGAVLAAAAQAGARAVGYELNPLLVAAAWLRLRRYGGRASIRLADMWRLPALPSGTTLVYVFVVGRDVPRLDTCLKAWVVAAGQPIHVISYGFELPRPALKTESAMHLYRFDP